MTIRDVHLELIDDNPYNPRKHYSQTKVKEMAQSLRENGLRQVPEGRPVDGRVQLAYGHMRLRGFRQNQKKDGDSWKAMPVDVEEISDQDMFHFAMEENLTRTDITPLEVARCIETFSQMFPDVLDEEIARKHNMTAANVSNMKRVLRLPEKILEKIDSGVINFTQGRELLTLEGLPDAENLMVSALGGLRTGNKAYGHSNTVEGLQVSIHEVVSRHFRPLDKKWQGYRWDLLFDTREAGCLKCDKMIRTRPTKSETAHYCLGAECWDRHLEEHREKAAAEAKARMEAEILKRAATTTEPPEPPGARVYRIQNQITKEWWDGLAASPEAALAKAGWNKEGCWMRVKTERGGWANVNISQEMSEIPAELKEKPDATDAFLEQVAKDQEALAMEREGRAELDQIEAEALADERDRQMEESRERANLERPVGELPCDTCAKGNTCDRTFFHVADDGSGRLVCDVWECDHVSWAAPPEQQEAIPEEVLTKAKEAAGTRAEVLDVHPLYSDPWRRELKGGYVLLNAVIDEIDDPQECLERCTRGFHYAFDSGHPDRRQLAVCTDPKCVTKKKAALTREKNAEGQARKKAEQKAIQIALSNTTAIGRNELKVILLCQVSGSHLATYYYGGNEAKKPAKWLWDKLSAGTPEGKRAIEHLFKLIDGLDDLQLARLVMELMFYYLVDHVDVAHYSIKTEMPLKWLGVDIQLEEVTSG